jgi:hypothetical protein
MNQQDVFLVNMRELYAKRIHKDPVWRYVGYVKPPDLTPGIESGSETVAFVVDWQMESMEYEIIEKSYTPTEKAESYNKAASSKTQ